MMDASAFHTILLPLRDRGYHTVGTLRTNRIGVYRAGVKKKVQNTLEGIASVIIPKYATTILLF